MLLKINVAGASPTLAGIMMSPPSVRAKASAIWLRQALPIQTNRTRFLLAGVIAFPETGYARARRWSVPDGRWPRGAAPARPAPRRPRIAPAPGPRHRRRG